MRASRRNIIITAIGAVVIVGGALLYQVHQNGFSFTGIDNAVTYARPNSAVSNTVASQYDWKQGLTTPPGGSNQEGSISQPPTSANVGNETVPATTTLPELPSLGPLTDALNKNAIDVLSSVSSMDQLDAITSGSGGVDVSQFKNDPRFASFFNPTTYTANDLTATSSNPHTVINFFSYILGTLTYYSRQYPGDPMQIVSSSTDATNPDSSQLPKLATYVTAYDQLARALATIPVPPELARDDLDLINACFGLKLATSNMEHVLDDPTRGTLGIQQYSEYMHAYADATQHLYTSLQGYTK